MIATKKSFYQPLLKKFFPPPRYLKMEAVGIDISDRAIRYLSFKNKGSVREIDVFGEVALPEGALSGGHINKPNIVSSVLRGIADKLKNKLVRVSLPEEKAYIYQTQVPKVPGVELYESISYTLEENVPIKPSEAVFDYFLIPSKDLQSEHVDVVVVAIPQKVSEIYDLVLNEAGLFPLSFEIGSQAIVRAVADQGDHQVRLVVNLNETKTSFSIVSRGLVRFTSTVQAGGGDIDRYLIELTGKTLEQVKMMKKTSAMEGEQDMDLFFKLMESTKPIQDEIRKLQSYWKTHGAGKSGLSKEIAEIILVGKDTAVPAVSEYLESVIGIKTSVSNVWRNSFSLEDYVPDLGFYNALDYAGAIGLALGNDLNN